jgi:hypothetical protein
LKLKEIGRVGAGTLTCPYEGSKVEHITAWVSDQKGQQTAETMGFFTTGYNTVIFPLDSWWGR